MMCSKSQGINSINLLSSRKNYTTIPNCGAPDCTNRSSTHPEKSFHGLPSISEKKCDLWMAKINQKLLPKKLFICSDHSFKLNVLERISR